jgi:hypothetical protein
VTIARAIRRSFRLFPYFREDANAGFEVLLRNIFDQFLAQIVSRIKNLIENRFGTPLEMDRLATPIVGGTPALHPAIVLEAIEQSGERCTFDSHPLRDFFLSEPVSALRKMHQRPPFPLAQAERPQPLIEPRPPGTGGAEKDKTEFAEIR